MRPTLVALTTCALVVALARDGLRQQCPRLGCFVWRIDLLPTFQPGAEKANTSFGISGSEKHRAARCARGSLERRRVVGRGDRLQLVGGLTCALEVAGLQRDLDHGRQETAARQLAGGFLFERAADRSHRGIDLPTG